MNSQKIIIGDTKDELFGILSNRYFLEITLDNKLGKSTPWQNVENYVYGKFYKNPFLYNQTIIASKQKGDSGIDNDNNMSIFFQYLVSENITTIQSSLKDFILTFANNNKQYRENIIKYINFFYDEKDDPILGRNKKTILDDVFDETTQKYKAEKVDVFIGNNILPAAMKQAAKELEQRNKKFIAYDKNKGLVHLYAYFLIKKLYEEGIDIYQFEDWTCQEIIYELGSLYPDVGREVSEERYKLFLKTNNLQDSDFTAEDRSTVYFFIKNVYYKEDVDKYNAYDNFGREVGEFLLKDEDDEWFGKEFNIKEKKNIAALFQSYINENDPEKFLKLKFLISKGFVNRDRFYIDEKNKISREKIDELEQKHIYYLELNNEEKDQKVKEKKTDYVISDDKEDLFSPYYPMNIIYKDKFFPNINIFIGYIIMLIFQKSISGTKMNIVFDDELYKFFLINRKTEGDKNLMIIKNTIKLIQYLREKQFAVLRKLQTTRDDILTFCSDYLDELTQEDIDIIEKYEKDKDYMAIAGYLVYTEYKLKEYDVLEQLELKKENIEEDFDNSLDKNYLEKYFITDIPIRKLNRQMMNYPPIRKILDVSLKKNVKEAIYKKVYSPESFEAGEYIRKLLISTKNKYIEYLGKDENGIFGVTSGNKENYVGKVYMEIRKELIEQKDKFVTEITKENELSQIEIDELIYKNPLARKWLSNRIKNIVNSCVIIANWLKSMKKYDEKKEKITDYCFNYVYKYCFDIGLLDSIYIPKTMKRVFAFAIDESNATKFFMQKENRDKILSKLYSFLLKFEDTKIYSDLTNNNLDIAEFLYYSSTSKYVTTEKTPKLFVNRDETLNLTINCVVSLLRKIYYLKLFELNNVELNSKDIEFAINLMHGTSVTVGPTKQEDEFVILNICHYFTTNFIIVNKEFAARVHNYCLSYVKDNKTTKKITQRKYFFLN